ncbi:hypothetical protein HBI24_151590 [Parastagonospora nodorum]|nr:hypothetical protein HBI47_098150 [Parastagonospora nodorum]KAH5579736.1 hypothetical protein HBI24_151590 [Parastagonospora nodorum]
MSTPGSTRGSVSASRSSSVVATKIFIDSVPEYYQLQSCAVPPVSAIVRAMASGCGDGSQMTSYVCFCYDSSTHYNSLIGADVSTACNDQAQASSAQGVFSKYCQIGSTRGITPVAATASTTSVVPAKTSISPLSSAVSSMTQNSSSVTSSSSANSVASAATASSSTPTPKTSSGRTTTIAVAVVVPVVVIALILGLFLAYRRRQPKPETSEMGEGKIEEMPGDLPTEEYEKSTAELATVTHTTYAELPGDRRSLVELPISKDGTNVFQVDGGHRDGLKSGL